MLKQQKIFFDFLRFCIGSAKEIPGSLKEADWKELYRIAKKQALLGVLFYGIQRLPKELAPEQKLLMQWMAMAEMIRKQNIKLFQDSVKVCQNFENEGFANCILKGQGNALLYPDLYMRTPRDIDIYLAGGRKRVMQYINKVCPNQVMRYHHVDFPVMKTAIEVHFTPSYMFFPIHNSRMQKWFYRHVFTEGIGLRQLIDYYFVLVKSEERRVKNLTALQRELKYLGLWKFAGAVMYVLHEALGLPEAKMIAPIDVNEGRFLLAEIMQGGNFGQYDTRLGSKENEGKLHRYLRMSLRNLRFVKHYPTEALSEPLFRTWFALWKKIHGIK